MSADRQELLRDRRWMKYKNASDRRKQEYADGVNAFLDFAFANAGSNDKIRCPCVHCYLGSFHGRQVVFYHLLARGIIKDYNPWTQHGEDEVEGEDLHLHCENHIPTVNEEHLHLSRGEAKVRHSHKVNLEDGDIHKGEKRDGNKVEDEDQPVPCEDRMATINEQHLLVSPGKDEVRDFHIFNDENGVIHQGEKRDGNLHQENDEGGDPPVIPPNVWRYIETSTMLKTGETENEGRGSDQVYLEEDEGDQDVSSGEDDNANDINCSGSPLNQSGEGTECTTIHAGHMAAECESSGAVEEENSGNIIKSDRQCVRRLVIRLKERKEFSSPSKVEGENSGNKTKSDTPRERRRGIRLKERKEISSPVKVDLPASLGRVVGSNAHVFIKEASCLLKETLPPDVVKWKDVSPDDVAKLLDKVKKRFVFPNESHVDKALVWQFKNWFRHWRSELRRSYYNKCDTYDECLANRPPYLDEAQWKWLVDYWGSEKFKKLSEINSRIRNNQKNPACVGSKSIARHAYELENEQTEQDSDKRPSCLKLFERQKKKKDGTWINEEAEAEYKKLVKLHEEEIKDGIGDNPVRREGSSLKRKRSKRQLLGIKAQFEQN